MISIPQIKAARALLDWTQRDLARTSGISLAAIAQIESGAGNPRAETLHTLQQAFEKYDVEFSDDPGIRIRQEPFSVNVWQGREAILKVWKDIENLFADGRGGEVLLSSLDDRLWQKLLPKELPEAITRRQKLGVITRAFVTARNQNLTMPADYCRIVPKAMSAHTPYYVYQNKVAMIKMTDPIRVILINNPTLAESFREQFEYHWENGKKL